MAHRTATPATMLILVFVAFSATASLTPLCPKSPVVPAGMQVPEALTVARTTALPFRARIDGSTLAATFATTGPVSVVLRTAGLPEATVLYEGRPGFGTMCLELPRPASAGFHRFTIVISAGDRSATLTSYFFNAAWVVVESAEARITPES